MTIKLYADENIPKSVITILRELGHNILTAQEAGKANQRIPDPEVLAYATQLHRTVITLNRHDFVNLHKVVKKTYWYHSLSGRSQTSTSISAKNSCTTPYIYFFR